MVFEIRMNKLNKPFLQKIDRPRTSKDGRGQWVEIGRLSNTGIENIIRANQRNGYMVLIDEDNVYRVLVLTD